MNINVTGETGRLLLLAWLAVLVLTPKCNKKRNVCNVKVMTLNTHTHTPAWCTNTCPQQPHTRVFVPRQLTLTAATNVNGLRFELGKKNRKKERKFDQFTNSPRDSSTRVELFLLRHRSPPPSPQQVCCICAVASNN